MRTRIRFRIAATIAAAAAGAAALALASCSGAAPGSSQREGADLVVYSSHPEDIARFVVSEFRDRTGLSVRLVLGGTGDLLKRLRAESASRPSAETGDLLWGGGAESLSASADLFQPYRSAEDAAIPPSLKAGDGSWTGFCVLPMVIVYNRRLLPDTSAPRSWADALRPALAGRIAFADPSSSGSSYTILRTVVAALGAGDARDETRRDAVSAFAAAVAGRVIPDSKLVAPSVASGQFLVGFAVENAAAELTAAGSDLGIVYPADGTSAVPDGVAVVRGSPRAEAARRFVDFALSRDVALVLSGRFGRRSARSDVAPPEGLPALSAVKLVPYDIPSAAVGKEALVEEFRADLGPDDD